MRHVEYQADGGQKRQSPGYAFRADGYEQFQIIYVSKGELHFSSLAQETTLGNGGVAMLREGSTFALSCRRTGYRGVCFVATGELPADFRGPAEALLANADVRTLADLMERQFTSPTPESASLLEGLGRAMAWEAVRLSQANRARTAIVRSARYWAQSARQLLDATLYTGRGVRDVLSSLPLSYRQICRHFAKIFGLSPKRYQVRARVAEAQRLLANTRMSVTAVAMELGYSSSQHFATQFLSVTGRRPSQWQAGSAIKTAAATAL